MADDLNGHADLRHGANIGQLLFKLFP